MYARLHIIILSIKKQTNKRKQVKQNVICEEEAIN